MNGVQARVLSAVRLALLLADGLFLFAVVVEAGPPLLQRVNPNSLVGVLEPVRRRSALVTGPLEAVARSWPLPRVAGMEAAPFVVAALFLALSFACAALGREVQVRILVLGRLEEDAIVAEASRLAAGAASAPSPPDPAGMDRDQVLEVYAQAKRILDGRRRRVAFLAADVVGSTAMKQGEDPALAERDFRQYRKFVEAILARRGALKAAWTPDGVMICFAAFEDAVGAGQDLIRGLRDFNARVRTIRAPFRLRCGVNAGEVLYDDSARMEEMSDGAIDLAGHLQKYAEPDTLFAPRALLGQATVSAGFAPTGRSVDGVEVCRWPSAG